MPSLWFERWITANEPYLKRSDPITRSAFMEDVVYMALSRWENEGGATDAYYLRIEDPDRLDAEALSPDAPARANDVHESEENARLFFLT